MIDTRSRITNPSRGRSQAAKLIVWREPKLKIQMTRDAILEQLDRAAKGSVCPMLDNGNVYPAFFLFTGGEWDTNLSMR